MPGEDTAADAEHGLSHPIGNGLVGGLFAVTGPVAILLTVAIEGGLDTAVLNSWILAGFVIGGGLSIVFSIVYRQPLALAWTIPGTVLLGPALRHLEFGEVVGAYLVTGLLLVLLGTTGAARRAMRVVPLPIVMGMVAGIFLPFVLDVVEGFGATPLLTTAMVATFFVVLALPAVGRRLPPAFAALAAGAVVVLATPEWRPGDVALQIAQPVLIVPAFTVPALLELVVPLTLTVVAMQNAQGFAVLRTAGYAPPEDRLTTFCGLGTLAGGLFGAVPTCVTGPSTGILNVSGAHARRWIAGVVFGAFFALFGLFAPTATAVALVLPTTFIVVLGGLALLPVLRDAFVGAFSDNAWPLGTLTAFVVTVSGVTILRVGAAFWGLVFGLVVSWLCERGALLDMLRTQRPGPADRAPGG